MRIQKPTTEDNWLYQESHDGNRQFSKTVYLGVNADEWSECSDEEKRAWEEAHKPAEPPMPNAPAEGQIEDAEVVE